MSRAARGASLVLALALALGGLLAPRPAGAQDGLEVTPIRILDPEGEPLEGGGSATPFGLELPDGAECPGDTADDSYVVNSYMVPATRDPLTVTYYGLGPTPEHVGAGGEFRQPLYDVETTFFVGIALPDAPDPGEPSPILPLPLFDLDIFKPGEIPAGRYNVGIVCTLRNQIERVWNTQIEVFEDADDAPAAIRWESVGNAAVADADAGSDAPIVPIGVGLAAVAFAFFVIRRRQRAATPSRRNP